MKFLIPKQELKWRFIRGSGPGGQNVNKVSSAAQLRFDIAASTVIPAAVKQRLYRISGSRLNKLVE
jgi:ribosome-associated protein